MEISAAIEESLLAAYYGDLLSAPGIPTGTLNDDGGIVKYRPEGTAAVVEINRRARRHGPPVKRLNGASKSTFVVEFTLAPILPRG